MPATPCPSCKRNNAAHRVSCLYCGAEMPNPSAPPPARAPAVLPDDLDRLVRQAMTSGNTRQLQRAMKEARASTGEAVSSPTTPLVAKVARSSPVAATPDPPPAQAPAATTPVALPDSALEPVADDVPESSVEPELVTLAQRAHTAREAGERKDELDALERLSRAVTRRLVAMAGDGDELAEQPELPEVPLPPFRQPYGLVVEGPGDVERAEQICKATGLDSVTARIIALSSHPKVAVRGDDLLALESLADAVRSQTDLAAAVFARAQLPELASPPAVLAGGGPGRLRVHAFPWWIAGVDPGGLPSGEVVDVEITLIVAGEVCIRRYRAGRTGHRRSRNDEALVSLGDTRLGVVDLHGPQGFWRVVEGVTDFTDLPGFVARSARRSVGALPEALAGSWASGATLVASRVCAPVREPRLPEGVDAGQVVQVDGWPSWEEHTRVCRLLYGLP